VTNSLKQVFGRARLYLHYSCCGGRVGLAALGFQPRVCPRSDRRTGGLKPRRPSSRPRLKPPATGGLLRNAGSPEGLVMAEAMTYRAPLSHAAWRKRSRPMARASKPATIGFLIFQNPTPCSTLRTLPTWLKLPANGIRSGFAPLAGPRASAGWSSGDPSLFHFWSKLENSA